MLVFVIASAGTANRPLPPAIAVLVSALATSAALAALILAFGPLSGGHFNPLITVAQWLGGKRAGRCTCAYVGAQVTGGVSGAILAAWISRADRAVVAFAPWQLALSEVVASAGLLVVVLTCARHASPGVGAVAVGGWLLGAMLVMPSMSMANPAIAVASLFASGSMALPAGTVLAYVPAQILGAALAVAVVGTAPGKDLAAAAAGKVISMADDAV
jgi:glycerol uptake facilitator-like aquaporin